MTLAEVVELVVSCENVHGQVQATEVSPMNIQRKIEAISRTHISFKLLKCGHHCQGVGHAS